MHEAQLYSANLTFTTHVFTDDVAQLISKF